MRVLAAVALTVLLLAAGWATNPSPERHASAIRAAVRAERPLAGALGLAHLEALRAEYHDLGIASYTTRDGAVRSLGAFGYVHVRNEAH